MDGAAGTAEEQFERALQRLAAECPQPAWGLFGPGSAAWEINKEVASLLAAGRALLLQLAHPVVSNALQYQSTAERDLIARLRGTSSGVLTLLYGDLQSQLRGARALYRVHARIRGHIRHGGGRYPEGTPFCAVDPEPLFWVFATLLDSAVRAYGVVLRPLDRQALTAYYADSCRFAQLFGIPADSMPQTWEGFRARFERTLAEELRVTPWARDLSAVLLETRHSVLRPLLELERLCTTWLLPAPLRRAYGLAWGRPQRLALRAALPAFRLTYRALPPQLRYWPAYLDARRRLQGKGPDRLGRAIEAWVMDALPQQPA